jgi:hypothetical protein
VVGRYLDLLVVLYEEDELIDCEGGKIKGVMTKKNEVGEKGGGMEFLEGEGKTMTATHI